MEITVTLKADEQLLAAINKIASSITSAPTAPAPVAAKASKAAKAEAPAPAPTETPTPAPTEAPTAAPAEAPAQTTHTAESLRALADSRVKNTDSLRAIKALLKKFNANAISDLAVSDYEAFAQGLEQV